MPQPLLRLDDVFNGCAAAKPGAHGVWLAFCWARRSGWKLMTMPGRRWQEVGEGGKKG